MRLPYFYTILTYLLFFWYKKYHHNIKLYYHQYQNYLFSEATFIKNSLKT